jgi:restriction endonuclease S subunit
MKSPWPTKKLGEICNFIFGFSFRADDFNDKGLGMPVIRTGDLNNLRKTEKFYIGPYKDEYLVESGDILIGLSGTIISGIWQGPRALLNQRVVKLTNFRNVEKKFIGYILPLPLKKLSEELTKSAVKNVLKNHLANLEIPLPPLPIQQKIVKILDTIQSAVEIQEKIIEKTKELKKSMSLMAELFKYGEFIELAKGSSKLKKTEIEDQSELEIGEIPEDWEVVRLGDNIEKPQYGISISATDENTGTRLLRITDIQDEKVDWTLVPFCRCTKDEVEKYQLKEGDILVARIGATTGKSYFIKNVPQSVFGSYLIRIRAKASLDPNYLSYYFQTNIYWFQINLAKGGRLKGGINIPLLENLKIPLPPLPEQREIAEILQTIDQKIEIEKKKKELYEELFKTMLNKIMSQEIDVKK